jgi:hypothetical protein
VFLSQPKHGAGLAFLTAIGAVLTVESTALSICVIRAVDGSHTPRGDCRDSLKFSQIQRFVAAAEARIYTEI